MPQQPTADYGGFCEFLSSLRVDIRSCYTRPVLLKSLAVAVLLLFAGARPVFGGEFAFSDLRMGDEVAVHYSTQGCGGGYEMVLTFRQGKELVVRFRFVEPRIIPRIEQGV